MSAVVGVSTSNRSRPPCGTCGDLNTEVWESFLSLKFAPAELQRSAVQQNCDQCKILLAGLQLMEDGTWTLLDDVSEVYGRGRAPWYRGEGRIKSTLTLEVHFKKDRPSVTLEFFQRCADGGMSFPFAIHSRSLAVSVPVLETLISETER